MEIKREHIATETDTSGQDRKAVPFDTVTNFSLLGWILSKLSISNQSDRNIDLKLDD